MKQYAITLILSVVISVSSCHDADKSGQPNAINSQATVNFNTKPTDILKDFSTWYNYTYYQIRLTQDFVGINANDTLINKTQFLNSLLTGKFLAIKTSSKNNLPTYKLFELDTDKAEIALTIVQLADIEMSHYKMEGRKLPLFNFTDLNGIVYNKVTTRGKVLVLKCWFIHCVACVNEFPELNRLVDEYKKDSAFKFVSLARDNKNDLIAFLKQRQFNYAVVPNSGNYMVNSLGMQEYPTHIVVDESGTILKVVNSVDDLVPFLKTIRNKISI